VRAGRPVDVDATVARLQRTPHALNGCVTPVRLAACRSTPGGLLRFALEREG
jgi:hypothetical protein